MCGASKAMGMAHGRSSAWDGRRAEASGALVGIVTLLVAAPTVTSLPFVIMLDWLGWRQLPATHRHARDMLLNEPSQ